MDSSLSGLVKQLQRPEYTGQNRCTPCTIVNVVIALVLAGLVAIGLDSVGGGVAVLAVSLALIYFRGYLVPRTPTITKRYVPERVLAWFDKAPEPGGSNAATTVEGTDSVQTAGERAETEPEPIDPEELLVAAGAVEPCEHEDDLCLTESFETAWRDERLRLRDEGARNEHLVELFEVDSVAVDSVGQHQRVYDGEGSSLANWPSEGAMVADLAADRVLSEQSDRWRELDLPQQFGVLAGLRSFLTECPLCDGPIQMGEETVESCCRSWAVVRLRCEECDTALLEIDPETLEAVA